MRSESEVIHSEAIGRIWGVFAFVGKVNQALIHSDESNIFSESAVDSLWEMYKFVWVSGLIAIVLGVDVFCMHSMWISTCTFLGRTPDPRHSSFVTIVTQMTLVTLF